MPTTFSLAIDSEGILSNKSYKVLFKPGHEVISLDREGGDQQPGRFLVEHTTFYGVVGKFHYGPGHLLLVTDREQVARIDNRIIWKIKRIAIIPLNHKDAMEALLGTNASSKEIKGADKAQVTSGEGANKENETEGTSDSKERFNDDGSHSNNKEDTRNGANGSDTAANDRNVHRSIEKELDDSEIEQELIDAVIQEKPTSSWRKWFTRQDKPIKYSNSGCELNDGDLVSKMVSYLEQVFSSGAFYYGESWDLTNNIDRQEDGKRPFFCYNEHMCEAFRGTGLDLDVVQGYAGSAELAVRPNREEEDFKEHISLDIEGKKAIKSGKLLDSSADTVYFLVISRRSTRRAGVRYNRRGIDNNGYCANWVETEQIVFYAQNEEDSRPSINKFSSFVQLRGSLPIYFAQSPYKLRPTPRVTKDKRDTKPVFRTHFDRLASSYGEVVGISLVEKPPSKEGMVGELYSELAKDNGIYVEWFDFHRVCKGMQFNQVEQLFTSTDIGIKLQTFGWTDTILGSKQKGVFRVNCIDCLDRTNVVESAIARKVVLRQLDAHGWEPIETDGANGFSSLFSRIWADNGDAISKQYSNTNALKGDFTRTNKRNYKGMLTDAYLTLSRYFYGMVTDFFTQAVIDYMLGHVTEDVFDEFGEQLRSRDPGANFDSVKKSAIDISREIVLASDTEECIGSGWWVQTPTTTKNGQRIPELKDVILLVTSEAIYICDFDFNLEKVTDFHRVPLASVIEVQNGAFFGEILSPMSRDPTRNKGFVLRYNIVDILRAANGSSKKASRAALANLTGDGTTRANQASSESDSGEMTEASIAIKVPCLQIAEFPQIRQAFQQVGLTETEKDIVTLEEATLDTTLWDRLEYYVKRVVWA